MSGRDCFQCVLAFTELTIDDRIQLLNSLLEQLSADQVRVAVNDPECLDLQSRSFTATTYRARALGRACAVYPGLGVAPARGAR